MHHIRELVDEICASIPYHLRYQTEAEHKSGPWRSKQKSLNSSDPVGVLMPSHFQRQPARFAEREENDSAESVGGYFLLWPLFVARSALVIPESQQRWIAGRIIHIAERIGLNASVIMAKLTDRPRQPLFDYVRH